MTASRKRSDRYFLKLDIIGFRQNDVTIALHFMLKQKWVTNHGLVVMTAANIISATNVHPVCLNSNGLVIASPCFVQKLITVLTTPTRLEINILLKGFKSLGTHYKKKEYDKVLHLEQPKMVENSGFQSHKNIVNLYVLDKRGITNAYVKSVVANNKITTTPLDI